MSDVVGGVAAVLLLIGGGLSALWFRRVPVRRIAVLAALAAVGAGCSASRPRARPTSAGA